MLPEKKKEKEELLAEIQQYKGNLTAQVKGGQKLLQSRWRGALIVGGAAVVAGSALALLVSGNVQKGKKIVKNTQAGGAETTDTTLEDSVLGIIKRNLAEFITMLIKEKVMELLQEFSNRRSGKPADEASKPTKGKN